MSASSLVNPLPREGRCPAPEAVERFPEFFQDREDPRFLAFLFLVLEA
ncbi:hypothetical protein ACWF82_01990 [Nocardia sp. NPDC055053]